MTVSPLPPAESPIQALLSQPLSKMSDSELASHIDLLRSVRTEPAAMAQAVGTRKVAKPKTPPKAIDISEFAS